jgi:transcriptional regulator with XRE-family HTH domain
VNRNSRLAAAIAADGRPKYVVAASVGVNPSTFSGYISGRLDPPPDVRRGIAETLGVDEDTIFGEAVVA